jgi:hypothetical protein
MIWRNCWGGVGGGGKGGAQTKSEKKTTELELSF